MEVNVNNVKIHNDFPHKLCFNVDGREIYIFLATNCFKL